MALVPPQSRRTLPVDEHAGQCPPLASNPVSKPLANANTPLRSCLYECSIMHRRVAPKVHAFRHGLFMALLDLDELEEICQRLRLWSHQRANLYSFRAQDHLEYGSSTSLKSSVLAWLADQGQVLPATTRIQLLTLPRVAGYVFNPVSFYFCSDADGQALGAVAEVGNTFGELKPYWIPCTSAGTTDPSGPGAVPAQFHQVVPKEFYVSPFFGLCLAFDFRLKSPGDRLSIAVNDVDTATGQTLLFSTLTGTRCALSDRELVRLSLRYPLVTVRVITLIHWHALRLWWKRIPWHRKSEAISDQRGVFRPHSTLRQPEQSPP